MLYEKRTYLLKNYKKDKMTGIRLLSNEINAL